MEGKEHYSFKHGMAGGKKKTASRLYNIWLHMRRRCFTKTCKDYKYYGQRGITVCEEWNDFRNFQEWAVNNGYKENLTLDRKDVNGNYEPLNCKWATRKEQVRNTNSTKMVEYKGQIKPLAEWAEILGINYSALRRRIYLNWDIERAFTEPLKIKGDK